ncbi:hypothetical protein FF1_024823 [Malus domestica]
MYGVQFSGDVGLFLGNSLLLVLVLEVAMLSLMHQFIRVLEVDMLLHMHQLNRTRPQDSIWIISQYPLLLAGIGIMDFGNVVSLGPRCGSSAAQLVSGAWSVILLLCHVLLQSFLFLILSCESATSIKIFLATPTIWQVAPRDEMMLDYLKKGWWPAIGTERQMEGTYSNAVNKY